MRRKKRLFKSAKRKGNKALYILLGIIGACIVFVAIGIWMSHPIAVRQYNIEYANLPEAFDGYTIVQLSDYHKGIYTQDNQALLDAITPLKPDIIVLTGDIIDKNSKDITQITALCESLTEIAQVVWIRGNHFYKADENLAQQLDVSLAEMGIIALVNDCLSVTINNEHITFCGIDDTERLYSGEVLPGEYINKTSRKVVKRYLDETQVVATAHYGFKILLSHRFALADMFPQYGYSLAIAGHSHGGQLKLPGGIEVIGHSLELFPKIKSGYNDIDGMPLIVSSGLGTSNINLRLYNPPEVVLVRLKHK